MSLFSYTRLLVGVAGVALLCACAAPDPLEDDLPDMGDFRLKWTIVVADKAKVVPPSRTATEQEWKDILGPEIDRRFRGYEGSRDYHIAVNVDGYALAVPGIPILLAPKSILVLSANVWDHEEAKKLHSEPKRISVFEGASADTVIGSGFTKSREEQMQVLSRNAARAIQDWMLENPEWFGLPPKPADSE